MTQSLRLVRIALAALAAIIWHYAPARTAVGPTITLFEYGFELSAPLTTGRQLIRVRNGGAEPHDLLLARLAPGKSVGDLPLWIATQQGPAPIAPVSGLTPLAPGTEATITVDITPGEYGLICIFPDARDGRPHYMHGMMRQLTVPAHQVIAAR
jgi:hypothetical protein